METVTDYQEIERYLRDPEGERDRFWMGPGVYWFDWREYDEDIVRCISESLPEGAQFRFEVRASALPRGVDILLEQSGVLSPIPYKPDRMDRDTTLKAVQALIAPDWQLRCFAPSLRSDTVGFCLLSGEEWRSLEEAFGTEVVARQFRPVGPESCMFGLCE